MDDRHFCYITKLTKETLMWSLGEYGRYPICCSLQHSVFFTGKFSLNFDLKNMISTYTKDHGKNDPNSPDFEDCFHKLPDFKDKFQQVAKNIEGFGFFPTFISSMQPNLAKLFCEWLPLWLHHKILKRNPAPATLQETHPKPNSGRLDVEKLILLLTIDPSPLCTLTWHNMHHDGSPLWCTSWWMWVDL